MGALFNASRVAGIGFTVFCIPLFASDFEELRAKAAKNALLESSAIDAEQQSELMLRVLSREKKISPEREPWIVRLEAAAARIKDECVKATYQSTAATLRAAHDLPSSLMRLQQAHECPAPWAEAATRILPLALKERNEELNESVVGATLTLASEGAFPYAFAESALSDKELDPLLTDRLISIGLSAYTTTEQQHWSQHLRFLRFLDSQHQRIRPAAAKEAFENAARKILSARKLSDTETRLITTKGSVQFGDRDLALSLLLELSKRFDMEAKFRERMPSFQAVPQEMQILGGMKAGTGVRKEPSRGTVLTMKMNPYLAAISATTPLAEIERISTDPMIRSGLFAHKAAITPVEDDEGKAALRLAKSGIEQLSDATETLVVLLGYLGAAHKRGDQEAAGWAAEKLFYLADSEYSKMEEKPARLADNGIFIILSRAISGTRKQNISRFYDLISQLKHPELRAFLYSEVAYRLDN